MKHSLSESSALAIDFPLLLPTVTSSNSTDEFGRDRGKYEETARQRRAAEREGRRNRRRKQRSSASTHHEGMSSDDEELDSEVNKFKTDKGMNSLPFWSWICKPVWFKVFAFRQNSCCSAFLHGLVMMVEMDFCYRKRYQDI